MLTFGTAAGLGPGAAALVLPSFLASFTGPDAPDGMLAIAPWWSKNSSV